MADKRTLNIPMYETTEHPDGAPYDDDIIDVETFDDVPLADRLRQKAREGAAAVSEAIRNARINGAQDAFFTQPADSARTARGKGTPRAAEREAARSHRSEQWRVRDAQRAEAKKALRDRSLLAKAAKNDPLTQLRLDTTRAGEAYMDNLRRSGILAAAQTPAAQREELSGLHQIYASMMVLQCVKPLQQGLSGQNVVSALGMAASMWALSPDFRVQMGTFASRIGDAVQAKIDGKSEAKDDKARSRYEKLAAQGKSDQLSGRWRRRLDRIQSAERGHRLPFTAQSAAMTEVALAEAAYEDMRRAGADPQVIQERYDKALSSLYGFVEQDGIEREDVSRSMRVIVGQRMEKEPELASVFSELGHGRFAKSEPREVYINGTTKTATVWTGDFVDSYEGRTITSGSFRLRPVLSSDEHRVLAAETLAAEMTSAKSVSEINDVLSQYVVASSVGSHPQVVGNIEDPAARRRFEKARTMFSSMEADGLSPEQQRFAYSAAYIDAIEVTQVLKPELAAQWVSQYGENWKEKVAEDMGGFSRPAPSGARARPAPAGPHFTASRSHSEQAATEDVVDAEFVADDHTDARPTRRTAVDQMVYEGELIDDDAGRFEEIIIDGESADIAPLGAADIRRAIEERSPRPGSGGGRGRSGSAAVKIARARVNQHYNEVQTGSVTGIGSDDSAPLQDVDYELG